MKNDAPNLITIGVTGHRKLENSDVLRSTVRSIVDDALSCFSEPDTGNIKLCCLSPLAEGADRLVAQEILKYPNAVLKAVLPLTIHDYQNDFKTPESRQEFSDLLSKSESPIFLRDKNIEDEYPENLRADARIQAYQQVGKFVVQNCDVLIGIWDGRPPQGRGGTADIIHLAEKILCRRYIIRTNRPDQFEFIEP